MTQVQAMVSTILFWPVPRCDAHAMMARTKFGFTTSNLFQKEYKFYQNVSVPEYGIISIAFTFGLLLAEIGPVTFCFGRYIWLSTSCIGQNIMKQVSNTD